MRSTLHIILNSPIQPLRVILVRQRSTHNWLPCLRCKTGWFRRSLVTAAIRFYNADRSFYGDDLHFLHVHFIAFNYCWCFMFSLYSFYVLTLSIGHLNFPEGINKMYLSVWLGTDNQDLNHTEMSWTIICSNLGIGEYRYNITYNTAKETLAWSGWCKSLLIDAFMSFFLPTYSLSFFFSNCLLNSTLKFLVSYYLELTRSHWPKEQNPY